MALRATLSHSVLRSLALALLGGCAGGAGCSSCLGGALGPIPGGFPLTPERRIAHALQVRLTDQGLQSVQAMGPDLLRGFLGTGLAVPTTTGDFGVGRYVVCPSGHCSITADLPTTPPPLQLTFVSPDQLNARLRVELHGTLPLDTCTLTCDSLCHGTFCPAALTTNILLDTRNGSVPYLGLSFNARIHRDLHAEHRDYFRVDLVSPTGTGDVIQELPGEGIEDADINCSGALSGLCGILKGLVRTQFSAQIANALAPIQAALNQPSTPDPPGCPTGTTANGAGCAYPDHSPVGALLGVEGQGNLGALLASVSPGVQAQARWVIAAGDPASDAQVTATGMSLNLLGAVVSPTHSRCVPVLPAPALPTVPEAMTFRQNTVPGTTQVIDLGLGLSQGFLGHALWNLWDAGFFCLGVTTRLSQQLSTNLLAGLIPSLGTLPFPARAASMGLVLRPQQPPTIALGGGTDMATDPLLTLTLPELEVDFYLWIEERYVRVMTAHTTVTVPLGLTVESMGSALRPVLGTVTASNTTVRNSQFLRETPEALAPLVESLLGTAVSMLGGSLPAITLPGVPLPGASGQLHIELATTGGVQRVREGTSQFLGLFANLRYR